MRASSVANAILKLLEGQHTHLTAAQVYEFVRRDFTAINRSTVYRVLKRLVDAGEVTISDMGMDALVYERHSNTPHHHLICQSCKKFFTLDDEEVRSFINQVEDAHQFSIITNHLILYGICSDCRLNE